VKHERKRAIRAAPAQATQEPPDSAASETSRASATPSGRPVATTPKVRELERDARAAAESAAPVDTTQIDAQLHTDVAAAATARSFGAKAVTLGENIYFAQGAFRPDTAEGTRRIKHELAHVEQHRAGRVPRGVALFDGPDPDRTGDVAPLPPTAATPEIEADPIAPFDPIIDTWDPATFWTPPGVTRDEIAQRLYGDPARVGGFDIIEAKHVRMRNFDGVTASDFLTAMREALDRRLSDDVTRMVAQVSERRIDASEERAMVANWAWWANRGDLTNAGGKGYFDAYLDELDTHRLTEWGLFSDTTRPASEWMEIEVEEQQYVLMMLRARRSSRGGARYVRGGDRVPEFDRVIGAIPASGLSTQVGGYSYTEPTGPMVLYDTYYRNGAIYVTQQLVDETTATRAETALRNSTHRGPRVMIPGGNGHFYGYAIRFPYFEEGYDPGRTRLTNYWWHYPGTIFIQGGEYRPDVGAGGADERNHRTEILNGALTAGIAESARGLDFDVLSVASNDQRFTLIERAVGGRTAADAQLIARILYSIPAREFPAFERRMSTSGLMVRLLDANWPEGSMLAMGRIFSLRALQTMRVPGENLEALPEIECGIDSDNFYRYVYPVNSMVDSQAVANFGPADTVRIGNEPTVPGGAAGPMQRAGLYLQPGIARVSNILANMYRGMAMTLIDNNGPRIGPFLPTQLVRVRMIGPNPSVRVVTAFEAVAIAQMPTANILQGLVSAHIRGGLWMIAGLQLAKAFGPALAEGLLEGGGIRASAGAVARVAATEAGTAALTNTALIGGIDWVEANRRDLATTPAGRAFLELYEVTMLIWISRDIARLVASGLVPRLIAAADALGAGVARIRDGLMPLRAELEAMRRAIARYTSTAEAAEASIAGGGTALVPGGANPLSFSANLRIARGEVAAEALASRTAGTAVEDVSRRVLGRLGSTVERAETALARATTEEARAAATATAERTASARLNVAQRANSLRPDAREAYLRAVDAAISARPNSLESIADLLNAAAVSRQPNVVMGQVQALISRPGLSNEALATLGRKVLNGPTTLDLAWLNRTTMTDATLDFLARDPKTPWDLFRRVAADPLDANLIIQFRIRARGMGAEMAAESEVAALGTNVERQVPMGSSEIDYAFTSGGRRYGLEVKGWSVDTWREALDAATRRLNHRALTEAEADAVRKIDHLIGQLQNIRTTTGNAPYLAVTDALPADVRAQLQRVLQRSGVPVPPGNFVRLSEATIKENAAGRIGETLGIPRPSRP
jgi:hypothetical protein